MEIEMHNVGFGDCFNLKTEHTNLIIDNGTRKFDHDNFNTFDDFIDDFQLNTLQGKTNYALLTHFHEDHLKGFASLAKKGHKDIFDSFLLPTITFDEKSWENSGKKVKRYIMLELAYYLYLIFGKGSITGVLSDKLLRFIVEADYVTEHGQISIVSKGDVIHYEGKEFKVLWPPKSYDFNEFLNSDLDELDDVFSKISGVVDLKKETIGQLEKIYMFLETRTERNQGNHRSHFLRKSDNTVAYDEFKDMLEKYKVTLNKIDEIREKTAFRESLRDLKYGKENIAGTQKFTQWYKKIAFSTTKTFNHDCNALSVVFHDEIEHSLLMTGDVTRRIFVNEIEPFLSSRYKCLKVPHHGTESYFSPVIPETDFYMITNGDRYSNISEKYSKHGDVLTSRICTLGNTTVKKFMCNCETIAAGGLCSTPTCKTMLTVLSL